MTNLWPPEGSRVAVAMSGGVDSAVAALLLAQRGYDVAGVTLKLYCTEENRELESGRSCCSLEAIEDAGRAAARIGIPHHTWDFTESFRREVIDPFREEYLSGRTPNPCVDCNRRVRFRILFDKVRRSGFSHLATGHYVRLIERTGGRRLARGRDRGKDQSYVLWGVKRDLLPHLVFPLGDRAKSEVREIAAYSRLPVADREESQDICFMPEGGLPRFLGPMEDGQILDEEGRWLGRHHGAARFTVGQRRGLNISVGIPLYVTRVDVGANVIRVGGREELFCGGLVADEENLFVPEAELLAADVEAKIRYRHSPAKATVRRRREGGLEVCFDQPQRAVTPGQSVAFYCGDQLLGGGVIREALRDCAP